jgi:hypothetical protein
MDPEEEERRREYAEYIRNEGLGSDAEDSYRRNAVENSISEEMENVSHIPLIGDWARGEIDRRRREFEEGRNRRYWERLADVAPTREELTARYRDEGFVESGPSAWAVETDEGNRGRVAMDDALTEMERWAEGGLTDTDRAMMDEAAREEAMGARADREAALAAMEARGSGGSGSALAASLAAGEGAATRAASTNASMMGAAQARQMEAARAMGSMGGAMRDADARRSSALDTWNAMNADYARDRERRNTDTSNRERDNEAAAAQREYENRERAVAGVTNQYSTDSAARSAARAAADQNSDDAASGFGALIEELTS